MTVKVTNKNEISPFAFPEPSFARVKPGETVEFENDVWDVVKGNVNVDHWVNRGDLVVEGDDGTPADTKQNQSNPTGADDEERIRAMTMDEIKSILKQAGKESEIKSGMTKDDLVKLAIAATKN